MLLASRRETLVHMFIHLEHFEEILPEFLPLPRVAKSVHIAQHDQSIASTRKQNIEPFRGIHKTYIVVGIAPCQRNNDNITFLPLIIVCAVIVSLSYLAKRKMINQLLPGESASFSACQHQDEADLLESVRKSRDH